MQPPPALDDDGGNLSSEPTGSERRGHAALPFYRLEQSPARGGELVAQRLDSIGARQGIGDTMEIRFFEQQQLDIAGQPPRLLIRHAQGGCKRGQRNRVGEPRRPLYRLRVELARSKAPLAIQLDSTVTRFNLRLDATFTLIDAPTGQALYRDRARAIGSYNAVRSDFATLTAEQDTERRGARELSEEIRTLLSVYLSRRRVTSE